MTGITTPDLYWTAGFLDGEGSFTHHSSLAVAASQVQMWPLERLKSLYGGSISTNGRTLHGRQSVCYSWYVYGHRAAGLMMTLYVLLSPRRQAQIEKALAGWLPRPVSTWYRKRGFT